MLWKYRQRNTSGGDICQKFAELLRAASSTEKWRDLIFCRVLLSEIPFEFSSGLVHGWAGNSLSWKAGRGFKLWIIASAPLLGTGRNEMSLPEYCTSAADLEAQQCRLIAHSPAQGSPCYPMPWSAAQGHSRAHTRSLTYLCCHLHREGTWVSGDPESQSDFLGISFPSLWNM